MGGDDSDLKWRLETAGGTPIWIGGMPPVINLAAGNYVLIVDGSDFSAGGLDNFRLLSLGDSQEIFDQGSASLSGTIDEETPAGKFHFDAVPGELLSFDTYPFYYYGLQISLYDADGDLVTIFSYSNPGPLVFDEAGVYTLVVTKGGPAGYWYVDAFKTTAPSRTIDLGEELFIGGNGPNNEAGTYSLTLTEPRRVLLDLLTYDSSYPQQFTIRDPSGNVVPVGPQRDLENFLINSPILDFSAGTYLIEAGSNTHLRLLDLGAAAELEFGQPQVGTRN
jgi:hypothetical protein